MEKEKKEISAEEAELALAQLINDSPVTLRVGGENMRITAIKPGTAALIAEESVKIQKAKSGDMTDILAKFAACEPAVVRCITLAILNDKDRIYSDYPRRVHSEEYERMYEKVMWESDKREWMEVLLSILQKLDLDFFFRITEMIGNFRQTMTAKRIHAQS